MGYRPTLMNCTPLLCLAALSCVVVLAGASGCDRRIEPFDPNEPVKQPDLSKIFPEGARRVEAREQAEAAGGPSPTGGRGAPPVAPGGGTPIRGTLVLAPELADSVPGGSVLFLVARNPAGGPPVAVKRILEPRFPMDFELGPDDRMIQAIPFQGPLVLSVRVDADGNATSRQPGDLSGSAAAPVNAGATGVTIRIDERL